MAWNVTRWTICRDNGDVHDVKDAKGDVIFRPKHMELNLTDISNWPDGLTGEPTQNIIDDEIIISFENHDTIKATIYDAGVNWMMIDDV